MYIFYNGFGMGIIYRNIYGIFLTSSHLYSYKYISAYAHP